MARGELFPAEDFARMEFNPFAAPPGVPFHRHYKRLYRNTRLWTPPVRYANAEDDYVVWNDEQIASVCAVVVLAIDRQSALYIERDLEWKLASAIRTLRIDDGDVVDEIHHLGDYFNNVAYEFFRMVNNLQYEEWWTKRTNFHNLTKFIRSNRHNPDKSEIDAVNSSTTRLTSLRQEIYVSEESLFGGDARTRDLINDMAIRAEIGGDPEDYAQDDDPMLGAGSKSSAI